MNKNLLGWLADVLTLLRGVTIPHILFVLMIVKPGSLDILLMLLSAGWITDWYDGTLARKSGTQSWTGRYEIMFDLSFAVSLIAYFCTIFPFPWWALALISFYGLLSASSVYGTLRHKHLSYIGGIEIPSAPLITAGILAYGIYMGSDTEKLISVIFLVLALFFFLFGLRARERAGKILRPLPKDIREAIAKIKLNRTKPED